MADKPKPGYDYIDIKETVRQHYNDESEKQVNEQINAELSAMYSYLSMSYYFDRADVALPNFASYFKKCADEEFEHAQKFMKYQNQRGGTIVLSDIKKPKDDNKWGKGIDAIRSALDLEHDVNDKLYELHKVADGHNDYELADFVDEFLHEQVEAIKELAGHLTNLKRLGAENDENFNGHGEYHFERQTLS